MRRSLNGSRLILALLVAAVVGAGIGVWWFPRTVETPVYRLDTSFMPELGQEYELNHFRRVEMLICETPYITSEGIVLGLVASNDGGLTQVLPQVPMPYDQIEWGIAVGEHSTVMFYKDLAGRVTAYVCPVHSESLVDEPVLVRACFHPIAEFRL
ncbi:hypothetical protein KKG41_03530 [Patescibacteria group bacterium]|nr:hypothetical protein [Patescibacteria group bacterium]MBU1890202.1 hypothetical protein [Patescibacteria group bacterium]